MRLKASLPVALLLLFPSACMLFDQRCGPRFRDTILEGEIRDQAGTLLGSAQFTLVEVQGDPAPRRLRMIVMGPGSPLKGHVLAARLVAATSDTVLYELPVLPGEAQMVLSNPEATIPDPAAFDALRHRFLARAVLFVLETDLPGSEELRVPLPTLFAGTWDRAHCS